MTNWRIVEKRNGPKYIPFYSVEFKFWLFWFQDIWFFTIEDAKKYLVDLEKLKDKSYWYEKVIYEKRI